MEKSLDELIEFTVKEIAFSGRQGATFGQIIGFVKYFYSADHGKIVNRDASRLGLAQTIDSFLLRQVWIWLSRHPDVTIGKDKNKNSKPSEDADLYFSSRTDIDTELAINLAPLSEVREPGVSDRSGLVEAKSESRHDSSEDSGDGPRFHVTESRIHSALCSGSTETTSPSSLEIVLLSLIAANRTYGILQGDLVRLSGQDKRSVPRRTDSLEKRGYIAKEEVYVRGNKTSKMYFRRFARKSFEDIGEKMVKQPSGKESNIHNYIAQIMGILSKVRSCSVKDLKEFINDKDASQKCSIEKLLRQLEQSGFVERFDTDHSRLPTSDTDQFHIKYLRAPTDKDLKMLEETELLLSDILSSTAQNLESQPFDGGTDVMNILEDSASNAEDQSYSDNRNVPQWNPDRLLSNMLQEASGILGSGGMTNLVARNLITGPLVRRTLESLLVRLSYQSLLAQPDHLQHLAIIRSSANVNGVVNYYHYALRPFLRLAKSGKLNSDSVSGGSKIVRSSLEDTSRQLDSMKIIDASNEGVKMIIHCLLKPLDQVNEGQASSEDLLNSISTWDVLPRGGEPKILQRANGTYILNTRQGSQPKMTNQSRRYGQERRMITNAQGEDKLIGRPRKFMKGTEKFWQSQFGMIRAQANPALARRKQKVGYMKDPACLEFFSKRPPDFDETLVDALRAGLPVPASPQDITEAWVSSTKRVLRRTTNGVYITSVGMQMIKNKYTSQVLILRSPRLRLLYLNDNQNLRNFRFISSSVSHSFAITRLKPHMDEVVKDVKTSQPLYPGPRDEMGRRNQRTASKKQFRGPKLGLFYEHHLSTSLDTPRQSNIIALTEEQDVIDSTDTEVDDRPQISAMDRSPCHMAMVNNREDERSVASDSNEAQKLSIAGDRQTSMPAQHLSTESSTIISPDQIDHVALDEAASPRVDFVNDNARSQSIQDDFNVSRTTFRPLEPPLQDQEVEDQVSTYGQPSDPQNELISKLPTQITQSNHHCQQALSFTVPSGDISPSRNNIAPQDILQATTPQEPNQKSSKLLDSGVAYLQFDEQQLTNGSVDEENMIASDFGINVSKSIESGAVCREPATLGDQTHVRRKSDKAMAARSPKTQPENPLRRKDLGNLCRKIILHLVSRCSGASPNDAPAIKRAMTGHWQASGQDDRPPLRVVKNAIKSLCENGKLNRIGFSFRGKAGPMRTRSILATPSLSNDSLLIQDLKQKLIDADPTDFIPPEWSNEVSFIAFDPLTKQESSVRKPASFPRGGGDKNNQIDCTKEALDPFLNTAAFLTLKVIGLGQVKQVQDFNVKFTHIPSQLKFRNILKNAENELVSTTYKLRTVGTRRKNKAHFDPQTHKIFWKQPDGEVFPPSSLAAILRRETANQKESVIQKDLDGFEKFGAEVDIVSKWEQSHFEDFQKARSSWVFINHVATTGSITEQPVQFVSLIRFNADHQIIKVPYPSDKPWPPFGKALKSAEIGQNYGQDTSQLTSLRIQNLAPRSTRQAKLENQSKRKRKADDEDVDFEPSISKRRKRGSTKIQGIDLAYENSPLSSNVRDAPTSVHVTPTKRYSRVQFLRHLPKEAIYRITVAVVCVRTLAGGLEKFIHWDLVMKLLPEQEEGFIEDRWKTIRNRYRKDIQLLTENLQRKYLKALERSEVPSVNFEDYATTNWKGIFTWALQNLDTKSKKEFDELPSQRQTLVEDYDLTFSEIKGFRHLLGYNINATIPMKESAARETVFAASVDTLQSNKAPFLLLQATFRPEIEMADLDFARARSWVLATILTPDEGFDALQTQTKLLTLADTSEESDVLVAKAIESLQREKIIARRSKPRFSRDNATEDVQGVRTWGAGAKFFEHFQFRRMITAAMLKGAVAYKINVLDQAFLGSRSLTIEKDGLIEDEEMVAVLNLMSMGMVRAKTGLDLPKSRYGIDWQRVGYETRLVDKTALTFTVEVEMLPNYVFGDHIEVQRTSNIPRGDMDSSKGRIPIWFNINAQFRPDLWEMFVAAIIGLVSIRPGTNAMEIMRTVGWALSEWEIDLILNWLAQASCVKKTKGGWETREWWWMCIGIGAESGQTWNA